MRQKLWSALFVLIVFSALVVSAQAPPVENPDPDPSGGGGTCTGISGCNQCVRDPFSLTVTNCTFVENENGKCRCWNVPGGCNSEGTCTYLRSDSPP